MIKSLKEKWDKYTEGWFGTIVYLFLGFVIAYSFNFILGYTLSTDTPVVAVFSCSMEHNTYNNWWYPCELSPDEVCGTNQDGYNVANFDDYWKLCGSWYQERNISKAQFESFQFRDGFDVGDLVIVTNTNDIKIGDVVVYTTPLKPYPIIHRVYNISDDNFLTKGDNNPIPDNFGKVAVHGKAVLKIPLLGWVKILFTQITGVE